MLPVRIKVEKGKPKFQDIQLPMIDPHILVDYLFTKGGVNIPQGVVSRFWYIHRVLEREEWALQSPASDSHIPVALYGDSARCYGGQKLVGIFLSFPLWRAETRNSRWCICSIEESKLYGCLTMDTIMERIAFSLNQLFHGYDVERRCHLANGAKFTCTEYRRDWLWHKLLWQFKSAWNRANDTCFRCDCKKYATRNEDEVYYNTNGNWREHTLVDFIIKQLGHRSRPCG